MLAYILRSIPFILYEKTIPHNSNNGDIVRHFTRINDEESILHLLQSSRGRFAYECSSRAMIYKLSQQYEFAHEQYHYISQYLIHLLNNKVEYKVLYECYKRTKRDACAQVIIYSEACHIVEDPITHVTVERVMNICYSNTSSQEVCYLFDHLSSVDQQRLIDTIELNKLILGDCLTFLSRILHRISHKQYYSVAYAITTETSLQYTDTALNPADYFIARKYTNWTGNIINTNNSLIEKVVSILATKDDNKLIEEITSLTSIYLQYR